MEEDLVAIGVVRLSAQGNLRGDIVGGADNSDKECYPIRSGSGSRSTWG